MVGSQPALQKRRFSPRVTPLGQPGREHVPQVVECEPARSGLPVRDARLLASPLESLLDIDEV